MSRRPGASRARLRRAWPRRRYRPALGGALLAALVVVLPARAALPGTPSADPAAVSPPPGALGLLWGRLAIEEESPDGPWTPLPGVEVVVYPFAPEVAAELERIRRTARDSGSQYESAVERLQQALRAYEAQVAPAAADGGSPRKAEAGGRARQRRGGPAPASPPKPPVESAETASTPPAPEGPVRRRVTDPAGTFVFQDLPAGEWLVVATHLAPYRPPRGESDTPRSRARGSQFLARPKGPPAKEAELWVVRVRVSPGERARLLLTDRARWLVGPVR